MKSMCGQESESASLNFVKRTKQKTHKTTQQENRAERYSNNCGKCGLRHEPKKVSGVRQNLSRMWFKKSLRQDV